MNANRRAAMRSGLANRATRLRALRNIGRRRSVGGRGG